MDGALDEENPLVVAVLAWMNAALVVASVNKGIWCILYVATMQAKEGFKYNCVITH